MFLLASLKHFIQCHTLLAPMQEISMDITKLFKDVCDRTVLINGTFDHSSLAKHQNTSAPELVAENRCSHQPHNP
jgi:hypothetical protein